MVMMNSGWLDGLQNEYLNSNPNAAFSYIFGDLLGGSGGNQNFTNWLRGRQNEFFQDYEGAVARDPNLRYVDFLKNKSPVQDFLKLAPSQRGISMGRVQPQVNFRYGVGFSS
ncbi:MAG: hypothetical protein IT318_20300 [Anaerolineales bacterium]|nr:hypothetical protein [Anaerolineales bacterium]